MYRAKGLSVAGIVFAVIAGALTFVSVLFPQMISSLEIPMTDGGYSLFQVCCLTGLLFVLTGIAISVYAGDLQSAVDCVCFLYAAAFCIICKGKGYEAYGLLPGILIVICDIASCFAGLAGIRMLGGFFSLTFMGYRHDFFKKVELLPFAVFVVRYVLVFAGVIDFWHYSFKTANNVMLWVLFTALAGMFFYLLKRVPVQSSLSMRIILLGFCLGFLPFLCFFGVKSASAENWARLYWPAAAVFSLLAIPISFFCAIFQKMREAVDAIVTKLLTGCTTLILLLSVFSVTTVSQQKELFLLLACPVVYQVLCIPLGKFLHPELTAVDRSLDSLERTAFRCSDASRILEVISDWLIAMFNPEFVAFYKNPEKDKKKGKFLFCDFKHKDTDKVILQQMHEERLSNPAKDTKLMLHRKNGFSVPMYLMHEQAGFIFIGARSENEPFSDVEMRLMTPVTRILMESMMVLDLRKQADYVSEMQNQIVFSFADMIESRDGTTGQHIKRTSTIVSLLAKNLREHNLYADKLLPSDYDMIALAAPLHDIGKIKVPDSILSKPGKLTVEEFETIKTHPVEGEKIISRTMTHIENERYLKLAREMALYHHEKWDGQGYPEGLVGEEIPVSARIMAIADVFDALCSVRSYKDAYSVSQAFAILEDSRGSHFEPCLVDAMKVLKPELEKIYTGS